MRQSCFKLTDLSIGTYWKQAYLEKVMLYSMVDSQRFFTNIQFFNSPLSVVCKIGWEKLRMFKGGLGRDCGVLVYLVKHILSLTFLEFTLTC